MADYLSVSEAAKKLGVTPERIRAMIRDGAIEGAFKAPNGSWLIPAESLPRAKPRKATQARPTPRAKPKKTTPSMKKTRPKTTRKSTRKKKASEPLIAEIYQLIEKLLLSKRSGQAGVLGLVQSLAGASSDRADADESRLAGLLETLGQADPDALQGILSSVDQPGIGVDDLLKALAGESRSGPA